MPPRAPPPARAVRTSILSLALGLSASAAQSAEPREELLAAGEKALAQGDAPQAALLFQRAGFIKHAADAEIGLTLAYMQAGEYRRAIAFAAHTAGAHPDSAAGKALYAQLLDLGGQTRFTPIGSFAPASAASALLPIDARVVSSGVLIADRIALSRASTLDEPLWVRNGLGALSPARLLRRIDELDLALLELERPLHGAALALAARDAFPGSPAYALEYPASADASPMWPVLRAGFLGRKDLGIALPPGPRGGPVLDGAGRLVGVALAERLLPLSRLKAAFAELPGETPAASRVALEEIYERALPATLQIIAAH